MWTEKIQGLSHTVSYRFISHTFHFPFYHFRIHLEFFIVSIEKVHCAKAKLCMLRHVYSPARTHTQWNLLVRAKKMCTKQKFTMRNNILRILQRKCNCHMNECHRLLCLYGQKIKWNKMKMKQKQSCTFVIIAMRCEFLFSHRGASNNWEALLQQRAGEQKLSSEFN